jgi:flagellar biosynthetic protein FliS
MNATDLMYRRTAVAGASGFGLLIALYDTLAGDLRRAAAAQRADKLEQRTKELKHALLVISYLQNLVEPEDGELAKQLTAFYADSRRKIIEAQVKKSAEMLEELMTAALGLRQLWQQLDVRSVAAMPEILPPAGKPRQVSFVPMQGERRQLSWTA